MVVAARKTERKIETFALEPGRMLGGKYIVEACMGRGLEGEVYRVTEARTGVHRAAKLFFPHENEDDKAARTYAQKLHRLRDCAIAIQYHHAETLRLKGERVTCLFSDFVDGFILAEFVAGHPGCRLRPFEALHLIYTVARGLEEVHRRGEYHGDIHALNILVRPHGIFFDVKLIDFYNLGRSTRQRQREDVHGVIRLLHEITGGPRAYMRQPDAIRNICKGMRRDLIARAFPTMARLRAHLETFP